MKLILLCLALVLSAQRLPAQRVISGNENKIDLNSGAPQVVPGAKPDSLTFLDFSQYPPKVEHLDNVPNSVIGPPSNIAFTPDGRLALVANSLKVDPQNATNWVPESFVHVLDLTQSPPRVIGRVETEKQPSGISVSPDGALALVANRASGSVSVLSIHNREVTPLQTVPVCEPNDSASDVAISPDGRFALVSVQKGGYLRLLEIAGTKVTATDRKFSVYGQPYRVVITPDGALGLTAGLGFGNGQDIDALSVVDLKANPIRTIDYIPIGSGPESIEVSPDGKLVAAVVMNGSNLAADNPKRAPSGGLVLLTRRGGTFKKTQELKVGRIPEGVAFTSDGRYLIVQCHPSRQLWVFRVRGKKVKDTGLRIDVPGFPSSLRAGPMPR
jgi:DNA-binding beta-propeller fold protein YncE